MASLFKPVIIRYTLPDGQCRVSKDTPGAIRKKRKANKWYGLYRDHDGIERRVPLSANKTVAGQMLNALVRKAELGKVGILDPFEQTRKTPLVDHVVEWETAMRADGGKEKHVQQMVRCVRRVLDACGFVFLSDLSASRVQAFLADLRRADKPLPLPDPAKQDYSKLELAALLGVKPFNITALVARHRLEATGNGKGRRYPKATAAALLARRGTGKSVRTSNYHLVAVKAFCRWLVKYQARRRIIRWLTCPAATIQKSIPAIAGGRCRRTSCAACSKRRGRAIRRFAA